jgi:hypothetical protein
LHRWDQRQIELRAVALFYAGAVSAGADLPCLAPGQHVELHGLLAKSVVASPRLLNGRVLLKFLARRFAHLKVLYKPRVCIVLFAI